MSAHGVMAGAGSKRCYHAGAETGWRVQWRAKAYTARSSKEEGKTRRSPSLRHKHLWRGNGRVHKYNGVAVCDASLCTASARRRTHNRSLALALCHVTPADPDMNGRDADHRSMQT